MAVGVIWTVLAIEVGRGILLDAFMIARGINVGGNKKLSMSDLKSVCESLGYTNVREYAEGKDDWREAGLPLHSGAAVTA